jgi:hypothetical protein
VRQPHPPNATESPLDEDDDELEEDDGWPPPPLPVEVLPPAPPPLELLEPPPAPPLELLLAVLPPAPPPLELLLLDDPTHTPAEHVPTEQGVPSGFAGSEHAPVVGLHVPTSWHSSEAVQVIGAPGVQRPAWHVSACVHASPSSHVAPSGFAGSEHEPVTGSHVPASWHGSEAVHVTGFAPTHAPAWQASVWVHALSSLHAVPSGFAGSEHTPVFGSQAPAI